MAKTTRKPQLGQAGTVRSNHPTITEFEQVVKEYKLEPDQYLRSTRLREWARRNKNSKYIPEPLLEAWVRDRVNSVIQLQVAGKTLKMQGSPEQAALLFLVLIAGRGGTHVPQGCCDP